MANRMQLLLALAVLCSLVFILLVVYRAHNSESNLVLLAKEAQFVVHPEGALLGKLNSTEAVAPKPSSYVLQQAKKTGYVLVTHFNEQLESSVYGLYQLTNIASTWGMQVVEPHIRGSKLELHTPPSHNETVLKFSDIFNLTDANTMFQSCLKSDYSPIIPFEDFIDTLTHNPVMVVVLYLLRYSQTHRACNYTHLSEVRELIEIVNSYLRRTKPEHTMQHTQYHVELFKIVCINTQEANNFNLLLDTHPTLKMAQMTAAESHSKLLILVPKWNGFWTTRHRFYYYVPSYIETPCPHIHSIQHSSQVLAATNDYYASLNLKHPLLGVHVRLERTIRSGKEKPGHVSKCVKQFLEAAQTLMSKYHLNRSNAIAFRDYGPNGSVSCVRNKCKEIAKELGIDQTLNSLGIRTLEYKPLRFTENAFVSSVEQELLSRADYLLTLGFGSFQASIVERFLRQPGRQKDRLVAICPDE